MSSAASHCFKAETMSNDGDKRDDETANRAARRRSIAIALGLGALVLLFYAATIVRLGGNVAKQSM